MINESGEKYACDACIRGHRVSGCNHKDRPLRLVAKKGRPITQCHHCRALRKSRASHVKCECGDKAHKADDCPHLAEIKSSEHVCCCSHGKRCTCALKKDPGIDEQPEDELNAEAETGGCCGGGSGASAKPRMPSMQSEPHLTTFANGHHKPVHHKNHEANHQRAQPYRVPARPHSIHGHHTLTQQRSMDHLDPANMSLPSATNFEQDQGYNLAQAFRLQDRPVKSENVSPAPYGRQRSRTWQNHNLPSVDLQSPFDMSSPVSPMFTGFNNNSMYTSRLDTNLGLDENPALSAASETHVDWSHYRLNDGYMMPPTSNPSMLHMERGPSSSGAVSEYDYQHQYAVSNPGYPDSSYAQSNADLSRPELYRVDSSQSFVHNAPSRTPNTSYFPETAPSLELDQQVPGSTTSLSEIDRSSSGTGSPIGDSGVNLHDQLHRKMPTIHGFSVEDAQKLAHAPAARSVGPNELFAQPASPWAHETHGEALPRFDPVNEISVTNNFEVDFDENAWNGVGQ